MILFFLPILKCLPQNFSSRENSTPGDDNSYSKVNNGYAEAGPRPSEMTDMVKHKGASGPAAIPDYAVVDKSAKKGKKKDKKVEEQKAQAEPAQYAAVDKSKKKKKKEEPEATYAQVDMSKKSKKVCQRLIFFLFLFLFVAAV